MKHLHSIVRVCVAMCLLAGTVFAQTGASIEPVLAEILEELRGDGWSADELQRFASSASGLDWRLVEGVRPDIVALALSYVRSESSDTESDNVALLAFEIARSSRAMQDLGFRTADIARTTNSVARETLADMGQPHGNAANIVEIVHAHLSTNIQNMGRMSAGRRGPGMAARVLDQIRGMTPVDFDEMPPFNPPMGP